MYEKFVQYKMYAFIDSMGCILKCMYKKYQYMYVFNVKLIHPLIIIHKQSCT